MGKNHVFFVEVCFFGWGGDGAFDSGHLCSGPLAKGFLIRSPVGALRQGPNLCVLPRRLQILHLVESKCWILAAEARAAHPSALEIVRFAEVRRPNSRTFQIRPWPRARSSKILAASPKRRGRTALRRGIRIPRPKIEHFASTKCNIRSF